MSQLLESAPYIHVSPPAQAHPLHPNPLEGHHRAASRASCAIQQSNYAPIKNFLKIVGHISKNNSRVEEIMTRECQFQYTVCYSIYWIIRGFWNFLPPNYTAQFYVFSFFSEALLSHRVSTTITSPSIGER